MTTKNKSRSTRRPGTSTTESRRRRGWLSWAAILVPTALLIAVMVAGVEEPVTGTTGTQAPNFDLMATDGARYDLQDVLAKGDALLYFSMGPGCDGCFIQIPESEKALADQGITLVPIMVDPAVVVAAEALRFGITTPILIDSDRSVSRAYEMIGVYGHQDRPSHSFAFVDQTGAISWVRHYAEMFVPTDQILEELKAAT